jgi:osmotically-inducible protein OsmY
MSTGTTEIAVKDDIVTLRGDAASQAQKELATESSKNIEGVKDEIVFFTSQTNGKNL